MMSEERLEEIRKYWHPNPAHETFTWKAIQELLAHCDEQAARILTLERTLSDSVTHLQAHIQSQTETIEGLLHEGRQGELEQANVGLAHQVEIQAEAIRVLRDGLKFYADERAWYSEGPYGRIPTGVAQETVLWAIAAKALAECERILGGGK